MTYNAKEFSQGGISHVAPVACQHYSLQRASAFLIEIQDAGYSVQQIIHVLQMLNVLDLKALWALLVCAWPMQFPPAASH